MYRRHVLARVRLFSRHMRRFILHNVLHADDPPERLARGVGIGVFITFTPTIGFQMVLVVFLAWLLRANKVVGLPVVWLSNPLTFIPIYYPAYVIGALFLGRDVIGLRWWKALRHPPEGWWDAVSFYWQRLAEVAAPLWIGCLFTGTIMGLLSYYLVFHTVRAYRLRKWGKLVPPTYISPVENKNAA